MCLGTDNTVLVSCSKDSNICLWNVKNAVNQTSKIDTPVYTDEILINESKYNQLHEKVEKIEIAVNKLEEKNTLNINATLKRIILKLYEFFK